MNVPKLICPKCKSTNVRRETMDISEQFMLPPKRVCNECGYSGKFFPEIEDKTKK